MDVFKEIVETYRRQERLAERHSRAGCELGMDCPVKAELEQAIDLGEQVVEVIRNLVNFTALNEQCSSGEGCPILQSSNSMIDEVIQEINDEWGMMF